MSSRPAVYSDCPNVFEYFLPGAGYTLDGNGNVSKWVGQMLGLVAYQNYGAQYFPGYNTKARNNTPGLFFNGGQGLYTDAAAALPSGNAPCAVLMSLFQGATSANQFALLWGNAASQQLRGFGTDNGVPEFAGYADDFDGTGSIYQVDACLFTSTSGDANPVVEHWVNGVNVGRATLSAPLNTPGSSQLQIGGAGNIGSLYNGVMQHVVLFKAVPSTAERQLAEGIESWGTGKNGSNLPSDHPNRNSAPMITTGTTRRRPSLIVT